MTTHESYEAFDARWAEEQRAHEAALMCIAPPLYLLSEGVLAHNPHRYVFPQQLSYEQWKDEQHYRLMAPIGSRVLLRRRQQEHPHGMMIYDTVMERVDEMWRWELAHVFYLAGEPSPFSIPSKKRKGTFS